MRSAALREVVRSRDHFRCGYCGVAEDEIGAQLTLDHYQPRSQGGSDETTNLVSCCHACNEFKGDYWSENSEQLPLHPIRDNVAGHVVEQIDHTLIGLTERGRIHIALLHLNRPELIATRRRRHYSVLLGTQYELLIRRLDTVEVEMRLLSEQIQRITGAIPASSEDTEA